MRLREAVNRLAPDVLERIQTSDVWKHAGTAWMEAAVRPEMLSSAVNRLSVWGSRLIRYWIRAVGPVPVQEERLLDTCVSETGLARAEMKAALHELCACGILYTVRKAWGERLLFLPPDCFLAWRAALAEGDVWMELTQSHVQIPAITDSSGQQPGANGPAALLNALPGAPLARRLLRAYAALDRLGLACTARGVLPKKTVDTVVRLVAMPSLTRLERLRPLHEDAYPVPLAMALEIAVKLGILDALEDGYRWADSGLAEWLSGEERIREAELAQLVTMLYGCRTPKEAMFAAGLLLLEPGREYHASGEYAVDSVHADWMILMHACGWAHYETSGDGSSTFRWLIDPRIGRLAAENEVDSDPVIVLPDGELIVPPGVTLAVRWKLEHIAQWVRDDVVTIYRMTEQSVVASAEKGMKPDELLMSLSEAAGGMPLPDELVHAIRHWSSSACRTSIEDTVLLRCDTKEIADAIMHRPELCELLVERIGDRAFIVRAEETAKLRKELERAGWPPLRHTAAGRHIESEDMSSSSVKKTRTAMNRKRVNGPVPAAFIYNEHAVDRYELLPPMADGLECSLLEQAVPDWPASWTGQLRSYHHSTRKQMIEGAMEWGLPVQLMAGGQSVELLPERLEGAAEPWLVSGYVRRDADCEPVRLTPDMWDEMRIVIPQLTKDTAGM